MPVQVFVRHWRGLGYRGPFPGSTYKWYTTGDPQEGQSERGVSWAKSKTRRALGGLAEEEEGSFETREGSPQLGGEELAPGVPATWPQE